MTKIRNGLINGQLKANGKDEWLNSVQRNMQKAMGKANAKRNRLENKRQNGMAKKLWKKAMKRGEKDQRKKAAAKIIIVKSQKAQKRTPIMPSCFNL